MTAVDNPFGEPMSVEDAMATVDSLMTKDTEAKEAPQEAAEDETDSSELEQEVETVDEAEIEDEAEPTPDDEGPQVLKIDEYGDVMVDLNGEAISLKELADGNLRQSDYTRKRQAESQRVKEIEAEYREKAQALAEREARLLEMEEAQGEKEPDWVALAKEDPLGWPERKAEWDAKQAAKQATMAEREKQQQAQEAEFRKATAAIAVEKFPEWSNPDKFQEGGDGRRKAAIEAGFTEEEYNGALDFRIAVLLEKARLYDEGKSKTNVAQKKIAKTPKVLKPGASEMDRDPAEEMRAKQRKRLQSGPIGMDEINKMIGRA